MSSSLYGDGTSDTSTAADADISPPDAVGPLATAFSAAYRCDAASLRIIHRTDRAGTECAAAFASMATALLDARARFAADCRVTLRARCSRLNKQHEEVDAVEKILEAGARLCCVNASDPEALSNAGVAVAALVPLCGCSTIPVRSSLIHVDHVAYVAAQAAITACVRVQTGPSLVHTSATGPGTQCLVPQPTADNSIVITCADEAGEPFRDLLPSDVEVVIDTPGVSVGGEGPVPLPLTGSSFSFSISVVESVCREDVTVRVLLIGVEVFARAIKVGKSVEGRVISSFCVEGVRKVFGLAINPSGTLLAASDFYDNTVAVYSLESAKVVKVLTSADLGTLGQEGTTRFHWQGPGKLLFAPSGSLLIAVNSSNGNGSVQEVLCPADVIARIGEFIRSFCVSMGPSAGARGVALHNAELLAVSLAAGFTDGEPRVFLFDYQTAALIRSFGPRGVGPTEVVHCTACRFTPDGVHLLVTSANSSKVAVFDVCTGVYVATIGDGAVKSPYDIDFASNGDILILDRYLQVSVFPPFQLHEKEAAASVAPIRVIPVDGRPVALTVWNQQMFVGTETSAKGVFVFD